jgi:hypothetical protein
MNRPDHEERAKELERELEQLKREGLASETEKRDAQSFLKVKKDVTDLFTFIAKILAHQDKMPAFTLVALSTQVATWDVQHLYPTLGDLFRSLLIAASGSTARLDQILVDCDGLIKLAKKTKAERDTLQRDRDEWKDNCMKVLDKAEQVDRDHAEAKRMFSRALERKDKIIKELARCLGIEPPARQ